MFAKYTNNYINDSVDHWYSKYFDKNELKNVNIQEFCHFVFNCKNYDDFVTKGFVVPYLPHSKDSIFFVFAYNMIRYAPNNYKIEHFDAHLKYRLSIFLEKNKQEYSFNVRQKTFNFVECF